METNKVTRIDKKLLLQRDPELERELPPLTPEELANLDKSIERDGILDAVKYWVRPDGCPVIIDGYNRDAIARTRKISYEQQEIHFKTNSLNAVKYWMHRNQGGRRGGGANTVRMVELLTAMKAEQGESPTKTAIIKQVAEDSKTPERTVWDRESKKDKKPLTKRQRIGRYRRLAEEGLELDLDTHFDNLLVPNWNTILESIDEYKI